MAIYKSDIVNIDLDSGSIFRSFLNNTIGTADKDANRFGVRVFRSGAEVDLSGCSCYGYFRDPQGNNIALTSVGTVSGNEAYITLPQACYNYEGQFCLAIKLIGGGVTGTVRIIDGVVDNTNTGSAVAPTGAVPTYTEILSQYDAMVAATAAANTAIAPTFAQGTAYAAGALVINDGALYALPNGHTAGTTWANTTKVATNLGDQVTSLKSAIDALDEDVIVQKGYGLVPNWVKGDIDASGNETTTNSYYRTPKIPVDDSKTYLIAQLSENAEGTTAFLGWNNTTYGVIHCYGSNDSHLGVSAPSTMGVFTLITGTSYIKIGHATATYLQVYETVSSYNEAVTPTGYSDTTVTKIDDSMVQDHSIGTDNLDFMGVSSLCISDKDLASPWFLYGQRKIVSSFIPITQGIYVIHVNCTNLGGIYFYIFNSNHEQISYNTMGGYSTPQKFELPANTAYIKVGLGETANGALVSHITKFKIYGASATTVGYDDYKQVIETDKLPALPPLALTGHAQGGIISMGHGGLSSVYAEDSIESFYGLARCGYEGAEVDIQFTSDNVPVCWHDPTLSVLNGATASDHIYDYTLAQLDSSFDFSSWWDTRSCFRKTVARFEEVCVLARAYGWYIMPDKLTGASGAEETNMTVLINMLKKYELGDKLIIAAGNTELREAFPNARLYLSAQTTIVDDAWANGVLRLVEDHCHTDENDNLIVDDDYIVYTSFNWQSIKESDGLQGCIDTYDVMVKHNIKTIWYTVESAEDIYQVVQYCPKTAIVLTGKYTIPDGVNEYIGIKWSNKKYDLSPTVHI